MQEWHELKPRVGVSGHTQWYAGAGRGSITSRAKTGRSVLRTQPVRTGPEVAKIANIATHPPGDLATGFGEVAKFRWRGRQVKLFTWRPQSLATPSDCKGRSTPHVGALRPIR